jgi:hypothetical protein
LTAVAKQQGENKMRRQDGVETRFTVKEIGRDHSPVIEIEFGKLTQGNWETSGLQAIYLHFRKTMAIDEATAAAKEMNRLFQEIRVVQS